MIRSPILLLAGLALLVLGLKSLSKIRPWSRLLDILPVPFWCYMLPMLATTAGLTPPESSLYWFLSKWCLPVCLAWLLMGVDVRSLLAVGRPVAFLMAAGFIGIVGGVVLAAKVLSPWMPPESWKALGALAATWTGGSANMIAVKEALSAPDAVFAPIVMTDGLFTYAWMSFLIFLAARQSRFDAWAGAPAFVDGGPADFSGGDGRKRDAAVYLAGGAVGAAAAVAVSPFLPSFNGALMPPTWSVILATTGALAAAGILVRTGRRVPKTVDKTGNVLLLILVASLGARATIQAAAHSPVFLIAGLIVLAVHGAILVGAARILRAPLALAATVSQACVGGVVSTPMVAAVYRPALAAVGLLLAVGANAVGTYVGLLTAILCRWVMK